MYSLTDLPVLFLTIKFKVVVAPDCINDAVLKPDVTGPISAKGAIKHPDRTAPSAANASILFIIDSPLLNYCTFFLIVKKEDLLQFKVVNYFSKLFDLFAMIGGFL